MGRNARSRRLTTIPPTEGCREVGYSPTGWPAVVCEAARQLGVLGSEPRNTVSATLNIPLGGGPQKRLKSIAEVYAIGALDQGPIAPRFHSEEHCVPGGSALRASAFL